jgi:hypothetical protein
MLLRNRSYDNVYESSSAKHENGLLMAQSSMVYEILDKNISLTNLSRYQEAFKAIV